MQPRNTILPSLRIELATLAVLLALGTPPAHANPIRLKSAEILATLSGNSVVGTWGSTEFRQYFDPNGSTVYRPRTGNQANGAWRVRDDLYCSTWPPTDSETCYSITRDGDTLTWQATDGGNPHPSTLIKGKALDW